MGRSRACAATSSMSMPHASHLTLPGGPAFCAAGLSRPRLPRSRRSGVAPPSPALAAAAALGPAAAAAAAAAPLPPAASPALRGVFSLASRRLSLACAMAASHRSRPSLQSRKSHARRSLIATTAEPRPSAHARGQSAS